MILRDPLCLWFAMFGFMHVFDERLILLKPPPTLHHHPHRKKGHIRIISWYRITPELNVCTFALVDTWSDIKVPSTWIGFWIVNRAEQWKEIHQLLTGLNRLLNCGQWWGKNVRDGNNFCSLQCREGHFSKKNFSEYLTPTKMSPLTTRGKSARWQQLLQPAVQRWSFLQKYFFFRLFDPPQNVFAHEKGKSVRLEQLLQFVV